MKEKDLNIQDILKDSPKYPKRAAKRPNDSAMCEGVYAGPEQMPDFAKPVNPMAMMTYEGPQFMNNGGMAFPMSAVPAPAPQQAADPNKKQCPICGNYVIKDANFCSECGSPMNRSDGGNKT